MEVSVRLPGLEELKLTTKVDDDEGMRVLKTQVSFEFKGKPEALIRVLNLAQQKMPIYAVIGCEQATFDLEVARIGDEGTAHAEVKVMDANASSDNGQDSAEQAQKAIPKRKARDKVFDEANPGSAKAKAK